MTMASMLRLAALGTVLLATPAAAETPVKFSLDWILQGQQAPFVLGEERGYYKAEGAPLTALDAGRGSTDTIGRIASGVYDIGFGDLGALIEFNAKNPGKEMIGVLMVYDQAPLAIVSLKKAGINKPADLKGKKAAAPSFDSTYRLFNVFARVNGIDPAAVTWLNVAPQLREPMLARGEADAIAGFSFTSYLSLEGLGVPADNVSALMYRDYGVDMYANTVIVAPDFLKKNPDAVKGFVKATIRAYQDSVADPVAALAALKKKEPLVNEQVELRRLKMSYEFIVTDNVKKNGFGGVDEARVQKNIDLVTEGFKLDRKLKPADVFTSAYLPPAAERKIVK
jgi:NitT/TauT family transport system substrate-binding protein